MIKIPTYNLEGEKTGTIDLSESIFGIEINNDLIYQAVNAQNANNRFNIAHTKTRGDVSGGGKKPWRQKGTGRARHGSIRSPLWKGGGVTFGPRNDENFSRKINKKARRKALLMVLTSKVQDKELIVLDELKISDSKTKLIANIIKKVFKDKKGPSILLAVSKKDNSVIKAAKNIANLNTILSDSLNVVDLLSSKYLLLDKESIKVIEKVYGSI